MAQWERLRVNIPSGTTGSGVLNTQGGILCGIRISGDVPGTADITLRELLPDGAAPITLLTLTNVTIPYDGVLQKQSVNNVGTATGSYVYPVVGGNFSADVAQGAVGNTDIWLLIE